MLCFRKTACKVSANRNEKKIMLRKWKNCRHNRPAVGMAAEEVSGLQVFRRKKAGKEVEAKAQAECEEYKKRDKVEDDIAIVKDLHQLFQHGKQSAKNVRRENTCAPQRKTISSAEEKLFLCGRFLLPSAVFFTVFQIFGYQLFVILLKTTVATWRMEMSRWGALSCFHTSLYRAREVRGSQLADGFPSSRACSYFI